MSSHSNNNDTWIPFATSLVLIWLAGQFDNHLWRCILLVTQYWVIPTLLVPPGVASGPDLMARLLLASTSTSLPTFVPMMMHRGLQILTTIGVWWVPHWTNLRPRPKQGCIFITGCDSGMGQATVVGLARKQTAENGYDQIFAGCYDAITAQKALAETLTPSEMKWITCVSLDVTSDDSVQKAVQVVETYLSEHKECMGLTGIVQYHGVAYNGPHYMPVAMYQRQLDVNLVGTIRFVRALLPLLRKRRAPADYRGRIVTTGTGVGPCSPCPPMLTAYMASKFGLEAYTHSLRMELNMLDLGIDAVVINPGFVKPTMLMSEGQKLTQKMWEACRIEQNGSTVAQDEFGPHMDHFVKHAAMMPGTHVSEIVKACEHALTSYVPRTSYKVGIDSKIGGIVGMMPTGVREYITLQGIYGFLGPAGPLKGYKVGKLG